MQCYGVRAGGNILLVRKVDGRNQSHLFRRYFDSKCSLLNSSDIDVLQSSRPDSSFRTILKCEYCILHQVSCVQICRDDSIGCHLELLHHKHIVDVEVGCQTRKERTADARLTKADNVLQDHFVPSHVIPDPCSFCYKYGQ